MAVGFASERLHPWWVQAQVLVALVHQVLALPVDKNKNFIQTENIRR